MKKLLAVVLALVMCVLCFTGCAGNQPEVGYANGYDVQIAQYVANKLNMKLEIYAVGWESLIPAVQSGTVDAIVAGMSPTAEREEEIDFTNTYYESNLVIIINKSNATVNNASSLEDLSGAKIAAQSGTFHEDALAQINGAVTSTYPDFTDLLVALKSNAIDGYIAEEPTAYSVCASDDTLTYIALKNNDTGFTATAADVGIAVGLKTDSALRDQINAVLATITEEQKATLMQQIVDITAGKTVDKFVLESETPTNPVGTLKVGMECAYEPFNWTDVEKTLGAVEISVIK